MPIIQGGRVIEGLVDEIAWPGAPVNGTDEVQTLTIGGTPTGGTFQLAYDGFTTAAITWSSTNATLLANINAALVALANVGASGWTATAGTLASGIGTILLTAGGNLTKKAVNTITVANNSLTGTAPTLAIAETTPGVDATLRGAGTGCLLLDSVNGKLYVQTSANTLAPTWTVAGTQT